MYILVFLSKVNFHISVSHFTLPSKYCWSLLYFRGYLSPINCPTYPTFHYSRESQTTATHSMCKKMVFVSFWFGTFLLEHWKSIISFSLFLTTLGYLDISCTASLGSFFHIPLNSYIVWCEKKQNIRVAVIVTYDKKGRKSSSSESFLVFIAKLSLLQSLKRKKSKLKNKKTFNLLKE